MILDVGCGGNFSLGTAKKGKPMAGDGFRFSELPSDVQIDIRRPQHMPDHYCFVLASAEALPFCDGAFSLAQSFDVIEHVEAPGKMMREMRRVARRVLLVTPNSLHLPSILMSTVRKSCMYEPHGDHIVVWSKAEMEGMLNRVGFRKFQVWFTNFHDCHHRRFIRVLMHFVPFPALRYRALVAEAES